MVNIHVNIKLEYDEMFSIIIEATSRNRQHIQLYEML